MSISDWSSDVCSSDLLLNTIAALSRLVERQGLEEPQVLEEAKQLISELVARDDWLPEEMAQPHPEYYRQNLLYGDPHDRFRSEERRAGTESVSRSRSRWCPYH